MALAHAMGRIQSTVLLSLLYGIAFAPVALGLRLFGRDALEQRRSTRPAFHPAANPPDDRAHARRQF